MASNGAAHLIAAGILEIIPAIVTLLFAFNVISPRPVLINLVSNPIVLVTVA